MELPNISTKWLPEMRLMYVQATGFPEGIPAAWQRLERDLAQLKGRGYYGWTMCKGNKLVYRAYMILASEGEAESLQLPTLLVPEGFYACAKLVDWRSKIPQIGEMFDAMASQLTPDPNRPYLEHYKSDSLLVLMLPICGSKGSA